MHIKTLLQTYPTDDSGTAFLERIRLDDNINIKHSGKNFEINLSYGISEYPNDSNNRLELFKLADKRMYQMKKTHKEEELKRRD
jgi:GGDEF domain-containing protein